MPQESCFQQTPLISTQLVLYNKDKGGNLLPPQAWSLGLSLKVTRDLRTPGLILSARTPSSEIR